MQMNKEELLANKTEIDKIIKTFFDIFTNKNGKETDWNIINRLCVPETIIIKKEGLSQLVYDVTSFIEPRKKILTDGTLVDFEEFEIEEKTLIATCIAHRFSRYQKNGKLSGKYFTDYGTKLFQFIKTIDGWKISSVVWEDDLKT